MIKKFKTNYSRTTIEEVECLRETAKMVVFPIARQHAAQKERKEAKMGDWSCYFDSWEDAHSYIVEWHENKSASAKRAAENARSTLGSVKAMKQAL